MKDPIGAKPAKRRNPSYFYSILSVALVLFMLGFFALAMMHTPKWVDHFKEQINVMAEIENGTNKEEIEKLINTLEDLPYIKSESVNFKTKEEIAEEMKDELGTEENSLDIINPFYDEVNFNLNADYLASDSLEVIKELILKNDFVKDVFYQEALVDQVNSNIRRIGIAALILGLIFTLIAMVLIHNTIRLAMYSNRFLIKNMQLVGASWAFISRPYLSKGITNGLWSGLIAVVLLMIILPVLNYQFPGLYLEIWIKDVLGILVVLLGIILLGILITFGSTYFVVNRYLKMRLDDLY